MSHNHIRYTAKCFFGKVYICIKSYKIQFMNKTRKERVKSIDLLRGLVMVIMALGYGWLI